MRIRNCPAAVRGSDRRHHEHWERSREATPSRSGPGAYDIHSPRVPSTEEIATLLREALAAMPADRLWVNPDCGLKTRRNDELEEALTAMVAAADEVRRAMMSG